MSTQPKRRLALVSVFAFLLLASCGGSGSNTTTGASTQGEFAFGEPADQANADRTIEIVTTNDLTFNPADLTVTAGETITFRIVNEGTMVHDFTLGD